MLSGIRYMLTYPNPNPKHRETQHDCHLQDHQGIKHIYLCVDARLAAPFIVQYYTVSYSNSNDRHACYHIPPLSATHRLTRPYHCKAIFLPNPPQALSNDINLLPLSPLLIHNRKHTLPTQPCHHTLLQPKPPLNLRRRLALSIPHQQRLPHLKDVEELPLLRASTQPLLPLRLLLQSRTRVQHRYGGVLPRVWRRYACGTRRLAES
jgi:hypothetical protein